jgi:hypothetical protein
MGEDMKKFILKYYKINGTTEFIQEFSSFNEAVISIEENEEIQNVKFALICELKNNDQILRAVRVNDIWKLTKDEKRGKK